MQNHDCFQGPILCLALVGSSGIGETVPLLQRRGWCSGVKRGMTCTQIAMMLQILICLERGTESSESSDRERSF